MIDKLLIIGAYATPVLLLLFICIYITRKKWLNWMLEILILFAFFTSIGSFSSLVIHRLPVIESGNKSINLISPRSYCPHCEQTLPIKSLIPIFSFIIYQGKCSICHEKIAISYLHKNFNINVKNPLEICALINLDIKPTL